MQIRRKSTDYRAVSQPIISLLELHSGSVPLDKQINTRSADFGPYFPPRRDGIYTHGFFTTVSYIKIVKTYFAPNRNAATVCAHA